MSGQASGRPVLTKIIPSVRDPEKCEMGQRALSRKLLQSVLDEQPENGAALRTRGQINLMDGPLDEAETDLRHAIRVLPFDHASHWTLHQLYNGEKMSSFSFGNRRSR